MGDAATSGSDDARTVVITGASAGVGRATAHRFAREGARIGLIARGRAGLEAAADEIRELGGDPFVACADVADAGQVERAAQEIEAALGPIDVWVNNAMTAVLAEVAETTAEEFRRVTEVTYLGAVHGAQAALRRMLPRDRGHIVQVGSALGIRGIPLQATYCAAKHAVQGFVESLRCELRHRDSNVRLTIVQLPGLNTTQFTWVRARTEGEPMPVPPIYQPEVAADAIHWASLHDRREVWVGAPTVWTIIGSRLAPGIAERYLARTGYDSQQNGHPLDPGRPDYVFASLDADRDHGVHGPYSDQAHGHSAQAWLARHRAQVGAAAGALTAVAAGARLAAAARR
jgi:NADP-dependent 3-hydroxy acid dehydrogenase YdfG